MFSSVGVSVSAPYVAGQPYWLLVSHINICTALHSQYDWYEQVRIFTILMLCATIQADESCNLEHIVSLWTTLSVQLAKQHTLTDQVCAN